MHKDDTLRDTLAAADTHSVEIWEARLVHLQLGNIRLAGAYLPSARMSRSNLWHALLTEAVLPEARLVGANLSNADLTGANLSGARLQGASLFGAELSRAHLDGANFRGCDMRDAKLWNTVRLRPTQLEEGALEGGAHGSVLRDADLRGALLARAGIAPETDLEGAKFGPGAEAQPRDQIRDELCAGSDAAWADWCAERGKLRHPCGTQPSFADCADVYRQLKVCFQHSGDYERAGRFFYRERRCQWLHRRQAGERGWFMDWVYDWSCGFGEHWWKPLIAMAVAILLFALNPLLCGATGDAGSVGPGKPGWALDPLLAIYFSIVTFTTLGYGDLHPLTGWGRFWCGAEALIGMVLMSLLLVCIVRKFSR